MLRKNHPLILYFFAVWLLVGLLEAGCTTSKNSKTTSASFDQITLARTECYGRCPVYNVTIYADGRVHYKGEKYVEVLGKDSTKLSSQQMRQLVAAIDSVGYFTLRDSYNSHEDGCAHVATDNPSVQTSITAKGRTKSVDHYYGCRGERSAPRTRFPIYPPNLTRFEERIDEIIGTERWVGK